MYCLRLLLCYLILHWWLRQKLHVAHKAPNNYDLDLYRESLLTSALHHKVSYTASQLQIKWWCKQAIVT